MWDEEKTVISLLRIILIIFSELQRDALKVAQKKVSFKRVYYKRVLLKDIKSVR